MPRTDLTSAPVSRVPAAADPSAPRAAPADTFAIAPPAVSLPKGGGAVRGIGEKLTANPATGACSVSVPLALSPGRAGVDPRLALAYDSAGGNGPFGLGWSLALPAVTRKSDKGLPRYDDAGESDVYILAGAEDLVPEYQTDAAGAFVRDANGTFVPADEPRAVGGVGYAVRRYRPRTEGLFARVERWTRADDGAVHWRTISKDNVTTLYGQSDARVSDPAAPERVFAWLVSVSYDDKGNVARYRYAAEDSAGVDLSAAHEAHRTPADRSANRYLKRVQYGNATSLLAGGAAVSPLGPDLDGMAWLFEAVFDYGEGHVRPTAQPERVLADRAPAGPWPARADPFSQHRAGFEVRTYRLCRRVLMWHHFPAELGAPDCLVRSTDFEYEERPTGTYLRAATQSGYVRRADGSYLRKSLPPLEFDYSRSPLHDFTTDDYEPQVVDRESLENLPIGVDGARYQWVDLDGEGVSGVLSEQATAWFYKPNAGNGRFGAARLVAAKPSLPAVEGGARFMDLAGDGRLDFVALDGPTPGFFERTDEGGWESFRPFRGRPTVDWRDLNLRLVDLTGDGLADVLVTENDAATWYASRGEDGFEAGGHLKVPADDGRGPRLVFADADRSLFLADMTGDGLTDLVRIDRGGVCYWPNLGYGRFGRKVTMDGAPRLDRPDRFDRARLTLADTDGSGTADLIYHGTAGIDIYLNESGNRWTAARRLTGLPPVNPAVELAAVDLRGTGTVCLVWSSALPADAGRAMRYVDLMKGEKPHLLTRMVNNLGAETRVRYASSATFYLADKAEGRPWVTKLPFPVHVVERVETFDRIGRGRFVSRHAYHHGHFDGAEREFRGFGLVERWDTEALGALADGAPDDANLAAASYVPPVLTKTWFHTGVYIGGGRVSDHLAGEYHREPGLPAADAASLLLPDTVLPPGLSADEEREACRALRGLMLREEIYALDGSAAEDRPYTVTEQNFTLRCVQPRGDNRHGVFFAHPRESITAHTERNPADPRVGHAVTLAVDEFGHVLRALAVGYPRRAPAFPEQGETHITLTANRVINKPDEADSFRAGLPAEERVYEVVRPPQPGVSGLRIVPFSFAALEQMAADLWPLDQDDPAAAVVVPEGKWDWRDDPTVTGPKLRRLAHARTLYRRDDLSGPMAFGDAGMRALPFESYRLALPAALAADVYGARVDDAALAAAGYVHAAGAADWWAPSGRLFYSPGAADTPTQELTYARAHFFRACRYRDPFHTGAVSTETAVRYDAYDLLTSETRDALGNRVTAGERDLDPTKPLVRTGLDYRVLQPALVMDPNRNRTAAAFDALGLVVGTAVMGKPGEAAGDTLAGFVADPPDAVIQGQLAHPHAAPHALLTGASTRLVYDLFAYFRTKGSGDPAPAVVHTLVRETHAADLAAGAVPAVRLSFAYSDGFGREVQRKAEAEPGPVPMRDAAGRVVLADGRPVPTATATAERWVGSGWTVFDNKGHPVRKYEPFFTDTARFEFDARLGVGSTLFYDPLGRAAATLHPDHTWEKVVFDPWRQEAWDANDTAGIADPAADPVAGPFLRRLSAADYLPTWRALRAGGALGADEARAARVTAVHAGTPVVTHADALGRMFLSVAHNRAQFDEAGAATVESLHPTRTRLDVAGQARAVRDADAQGGDPLGRVVLRTEYDLLGQVIRQASMEAGERRALFDAAGKPLLQWDSRGHRLRTGYDALRRSVASYLQSGADPEVLIGETYYGEALPDPEAGNRRTRVAELYDQAGVVTTDGFDFKGNPLRTRREFLDDYREVIDWNAPQALEGAYENRTAYDALSRPVRVAAPDGSVLRFGYNEAGLLERVDATPPGAAAPTPFVTHIDYDAQGRRARIAYGNGAETSYEYDPLTFRLAALRTRRFAAAFPADDATPAGWPGHGLQDLSYSYDPVGNVVGIRDAAQQTIFFSNARVEPSAAYTYDALYRLIEATGREHLGAAGAAPTPPDADDGFHTRLDHPGDGTKLGTYRERYLYDLVGNMLEMQHRAGAVPWTRTFEYAEPSQTEPAKTSNRLTRSTVGGLPEPFAYDAHGNMATMPHLARVEWDFADRLRVTARQAGAAATTTFYVYDSTGQRVRKVTEGAGGTRRKETLYLPGVDVDRLYAADGVTVTLERRTLHVMDDRQRIAVVERRTVGTDPSPAELTRYQLGNHLGTAVLELDAAAQVISYEEYYPFGCSSYQAVRSQTETPKRYRYTGKERDEETGLYYHGARYYAPWLARWTACDPAGLVDGVNAYVYVTNNPIKYIDPTGRQGKPRPGDTVREMVPTGNGGYKMVERKYLPPTSKDAPPKEPPQITNFGGRDYDLRFYYAVPNADGTGLVPKPASQLSDDDLVAKAESEARAGMEERRADLVGAAEKAEEMKATGLLGVAAALAVGVALESGLLGGLAALAARFRAWAAPVAAAKQSGAFDRVVDEVEKHAPELEALAPAVESEVAQAASSPAAQSFAARVFQNVQAGSTTLGRDMFAQAREALVKETTLSAGEKVKAFTEIASRIRAADPSWQANAGPVSNAAGFFSGDAQPFGMLVDNAGRIWTTANFHESGTFQTINGQLQYVADFAKWTLSSQ